MTVQASATSVEFIENGVTLTHPISFQFQEAASIVVTRTVGAIATLLSQPGDYTVTGGNGDVGTVIKSSAGPVGAILRIERSTARTQPARYNSRDSFPAERVEADLDRLTMIAQEHDALVTKVAAGLAASNANLADVQATAIRLPAGEVAAALPAPAGRALTMFGFDMSGVARLLSASALAAFIVPFLPAALKGDVGPAGPGALEGTIGLFTDIATKSFPNTVQHIRTSGRTVIGLYSHIYFKDPDQRELGYAAEEYLLGLPVGERAAARVALRPLINRIRTADSTGVYWMAEDRLGLELHAGHFGAINDGGYTEGTGAMTGTGNAGPGQALIDWRLLINRNRPAGGLPIMFPAGMFRLEKGLQLDYAGYSHPPHLKGAGKPFVNIGGTTLLADFDDHPLIAVNRCLMPRVSDIGFLSKGRAWYLAKEINGTTNGARKNSALDDTLLANTFDPALPNRDPSRRYNPFCAIAVDPYAGPLPGANAAARYPDSTPPAYVLAADRLHYGRVGGTTELVCERVFFCGFAVGLANQPSDFDANGDFTSFVDCDFLQIPIAVSVGNTQSRNVHFLRCKFNGNWATATTSLHGRQNGRMGGAFIECSWQAATNMFWFNNDGSIIGSINLLSCYAEDIWRIGRIAGGGPASSSFIHWSGGAITINARVGNGDRGLPGSLLDRIGQNPGYLTKFTGVAFANFKDVVNLLDNVQLVDCGLINDDVGNGLYTTKPWRRMTNLLAGGLITSRFATDVNHTISYTAIHETTGNLQLAKTSKSWKGSSRDYPASHYTPSLSPASGYSREEIVNPSVVAVYDKANFTNGVMTGLNWTFDYGGYLSQADDLGLMIGCVIQDLNTGIPFLITNRTGVDTAVHLTAKRLTGYRYAPNGTLEWATDCAVFSLTVGILSIVRGGFFTPPYPMFGDVSDVSANITNVKRADSGGVVNNTAGSPIQVGDRLWADPYGSELYYTSMTVTGVGSSNIQVSGTARVARPNTRLPLWWVA